MISNGEKLAIWSEGVLKLAPVAILLARVGLCAVPSCSVLRSLSSRLMSRLQQRRRISHDLNYSALSM